MHLPRLQISSFPRGRVGNTHLRKEFGCYGISFRRLLAYKFVGENANATIFKNELRNSFRRSAPIKTWTGIKKHTPTPMRIYNIMLLGVRSGGGGGGASGASWRGPRDPISTVEAVWFHGCPSAWVCLGRFSNLFTKAHQGDIIYAKIIPQRFKVALSPVVRHASMR